MIKVHNVEKSYGTEKVLKGLNLTISQGAVYGLIGPNGCGKSTLLNMITGVFKPDVGHISIFGEEVYDNLNTKNKFVYIPDTQYFFGCRNIKSLAKYYKDIYQNFDKKLYTQLLKVFNLDENKSLKSFSKGMKKQAVFIVSMAVQPELLFMDELIDGIDPLKRQILWSALMNEVAKRDFTVVIASHNIKELESICSDIGIIQNGICILEGNVEELRENMSMSLEEFAVAKMGGVSDEIKTYLNQ